MEANKHGSAAACAGDSRVYKHSAQAGERGSERPKEKSSPFPSPSLPTFGQTHPQSWRGPAGNVSHRDALSSFAWETHRGKLRPSFRRCWAKWLCFGSFNPHGGEEPLTLPTGYPRAKENHHKHRSNRGFTWHHREFICLKFSCNNSMRKRNVLSSYWKRSLKRMEQITLQGAQERMKVGSKG